MKRYDELTEAIGDLEEEKMLGLIQQIVEDDDGDPRKAIDACRRGLDIVGERFSQEEYFVGDLIYAGEIMKDALAILKNAMKGVNEKTKSPVIFCTVEGDLHDIGKNIVKSMLEADGFDVLDLGVNVAAKEIVDKVKETGIHIVLLSGLLTLSLDSMEKTVKALGDAGIREHVKVLIGGNPVSENRCRHIGADAWAINPQDTVNYCRQWSKEISQ